MLYKIGDVVKGKKFGPMDHDFSGEVEKVYENSIMIAIQDYDPSDQSGVNELNGRAIIRKDVKGGSTDGRRQGSRSGSRERRSRKRG